MAKRGQLRTEVLLLTTSVAQCKIKKNRNFKTYVYVLTVWTSTVSSVPSCFPRMLSILSAHLVEKGWPLGAPMSDTHSSNNRVVKRAELRLCFPEEYLRSSSAEVIVSASWPYTYLGFLQENILQPVITYPADRCLSNSSDPTAAVPAEHTLLWEHTMPQFQCHFICFLCLQKHKFWLTSFKCSFP